MLAHLFRRRSGSDAPDRYVASGAGLKGIRNLGNTCYINASLQALVHLSPLQRYFQHTYFRKLRHESGVTVDSLFGHLVKNMWRPAEGTVDPRGLSHESVSRVVTQSLVSYVWKHYTAFTRFDQHDSHEFLHALLGDLHESLKIPNFSAASDDQYKERNFKNQSANQLAHELIDMASMYDTDMYEQKLDDFLTAVQDKQLRFAPNETMCTSTSNASTSNSSECSTPSHSEADDANQAVHRNRLLSTLTMSRALKKDRLRFRSIISDMFSGTFDSSILCETCHSESTVVEPFRDISIPIGTLDQAIQSRQTHLVPTSYLHTSAILLERLKTSPFPVMMGPLFNALNYPCSLMVKMAYNFYGFFEWFSHMLFSAPTVTLQECLNIFFSKEHLRGDNQYSCSHCQKHTNGVKWLRLNQLPEVLMIHLNRFENVNQHVRKLNSDVRFPLELNMRSYLSNSKRAKIAYKDAEYELVAVICHSGSQVNLGHYFAFAINHLNQEWYEYNDEVVRHVEPAEVLSMGSSAYILFYQSVKRLVTEGALDVAIDLEQRWLQAYCKDPLLQSNPGRYFYLFSKPHLSQELNRLNAVINPRSFIVSKYWLHNLTTMHHPGPIANSEFLCMHGLVRPSEYLFFNSLCYPLIEPVGQFLWYIFGGGPIFQCRDGESAVCSECDRALLLWQLKRMMELSHIEYQLQRARIGETTVLVSFVQTPVIAQIQEVVEVDNQVEPMVVESDEALDPTLEQEPQALMSTDPQMMPPDPSIEEDENQGLFYIVSAEWMSRWYNFVNLNYGGVVNPLFNQLNALYKQVSEEHQKYRDEGNPNDSVYCVPMLLSTESLHLPLSSLVKCAAGTTGDRQYLWHQVDFVHQTVLPPGPVDNWSLFGVRRKLVSELRKITKRHTENPNVAILDKKMPYDEKCRLLATLWTGRDRMNHIPPGEGQPLAAFVYSFAFNQRLGSHEEKRSCEMVALSKAQWEILQDFYGGGPEVVYHLDHFEIKINEQDVAFFVEEHCKQVIEPVKLLPPPQVADTSSAMETTCEPKSSVSDNTKATTTKAAQSKQASSKSQVRQRNNRSKKKSFK